MVVKGRIQDDCRQCSDYLVEGGPQRAEYPYCRIWLFSFVPCRLDIVISVRIC